MNRLTYASFFLSYRDGCCQAKGGFSSLVKYSSPDDAPRCRLLYRGKGCHPPTQVSSFKWKLS